MHQHIPEAVEVDNEFALRSAKYLARHGMRPAEITDALCTELQLSESDASQVVEAIAA